MDDDDDDVVDDEEVTPSATYRNSRTCIKREEAQKYKNH